MKHLSEHRCEPLRDEGPHTVVKNLANGKQSSVPRHREIKTTTARKICKDLDVPPPPEK
jgi:hypothetical protein